MNKIVIASKNPVKITAVKLAFQQVFEEKLEHINFVGVSADSGVSDQPKSDRETFTGAKNRSENAKKITPDADFWIGIEGGIEQNDDEMIAFAWVYITGKNLIGKAKTASFFLPPKIVELINEGKELGEADDIIFGMNNSKQSIGAVGILTQNNTNRTNYYKEAVILALIPFLNPQLFK